MDSKDTKSILITFDKERKLESIKINKYNSFSKEDNDSNKKIITHWNNGTKKEEYFINEKKEKNGPYLSWHYNGKQHIKCTYVDGKENGLYETWHNNGPQDIKCTYVDGKINGLYEQWHYNSKQEIKCTYDHGKINGLYESWWSNGQQCIKCTYVDGKINGPYERWNDNGKQKENYFYDNDQKYILTPVSPK